MIFELLGYNLQFFMIKNKACVFTDSIWVYATSFLGMIAHSRYLFSAWIEAGIAPGS